MSTNTTSDDKSIPTNNVLTNNMSEQIKPSIGIDNQPTNHQIGSPAVIVSREDSQSLCSDHIADTNAPSTNVPSANVLSMNVPSVNIQPSLQIDSNVPLLVDQKSPPVLPTVPTLSSTDIQHPTVPDTKQLDEILKRISKLESTCDDLRYKNDTLTEKLEESQYKLTDIRNMLKKLYGVNSRCGECRSKSKIDQKSCHRCRGSGRVIVMYISHKTSLLVRGRQKLSHSDP